MNNLNSTIRSESKSDYFEIKRINDLAFKQQAEGELIENLRKRAEFIPELSLVAILKDSLVGHILFFPITIFAGEVSHPTLSLAPMAVIPELQHKGIGGELIIRGLQKCKDMGFSSVMVLGHPNYYPRFGFKKASYWNIKEPFGAPDEAMMAIELREGSLGFGGGMLKFPKEYYEAI